jgi:hypothetical protein
MYVRKITLDLLQNLNAEDWMAIVGVFSFFIWGITTFLFKRISVNHIEQEMAKEGIIPPAWDKGIGARMIAYAGIIAFPNLNRHASLINIEATKRFSRKKDKYFAGLLISTSLLLFIVLAVFSIFFSK